MAQCELCGRHDIVTTLHHLTPKEKGGTHGATAALCRPCHKQVHALFTNEELAKHYYSIELLQTEERLHKFIRWIRKQPGDRMPAIKTANRRKKKKR
ncbi:HNH endonuclease [Aureibacillus halotolerans]|uniref:HNH endonuclease n=1 Tax=Aureibacillus halotolerans TaxID=1508390 RepID=A0A4R6U8K7_9BACI|nr:HNH endonuclease [Aureibacillus halotolerans]TDQ42072.1 HNH endonuclease [Aureibacillus halotolerans]